MGWSPQFRQALDDAVRNPEPGLLMTHIGERKPMLRSWNVWSAIGFIALGVAQGLGIVHLEALLVDPGSVALVTVGVGAWQGTLRLKTRKPVLPDDATRALSGFFPWIFGSTVACALVAWGLSRL